MKNLVDVVFRSRWPRLQSRLKKELWPSTRLEPLVLAKSRLLGCGGVSHGLVGTDKVLVCHDTMSSALASFL